MRRVVVLVVGLLVLQATAASAAPDVVTQRACSDGAGSRLERTNVGDRIKVRFEVYRSPGARSWRIELRQQTNPLAHWPSAVVIFEGTRVASESGDLVVQRRVPAHGFDEFRARAVDTQTGQVCKIPRRGFYCQPGCPQPKGLLRASHSGHSPHAPRDPWKDARPRPRARAVHPSRHRVTDLVGVDELQAKAVATGHACKVHAGIPPRGSC